MKRIILAALLTMQTGSVWTMSWFFKNNNSHTNNVKSIELSYIDIAKIPIDVKVDQFFNGWKNDLTDLTEHLKIRKQEGWKNNIDDVANAPLSVKHDILLPNSIEEAEEALNNHVHRYAQLDPAEKANFDFQFSYDKKTNITNPSKKTVFDLLQISSELLLLNSQADKSRAEQLNIVKSELHKILLKLKENPNYYLPWLCAHTQLLVKQRALIKQSLNNLKQNNNLAYIDLSTVPVDQRSKLLKSESFRKKNLTHLRTDSDKQIDENPKLLKKRESSQLKSFVSVFVVDSDEQLLSSQALGKMFPLIEMKDLPKEFAELNAIFMDKQNNGAPNTGLCDVLDKIKQKIGFVKLKKHIRNVPSGGKWLTANDFKKFHEQEIQDQKNKELIAQQQEQGNYQGMLFKPNPKFNPNQNNTNQN